MGTPLSNPANEKLSPPKLSGQPHPSIVSSHTSVNPPQTFDRPSDLSKWPLLHMLKSPPITIKPFHAMLFSSPTSIHLFNSINHLFLSLEFTRTYTLPMPMSEASPSILKYNQMS